MSSSSHLRPFLLLLFVLLSSTLLPTTHANKNSAFQAWMQEHHKTYASPAEQAERFTHWLQAYNRVQAHAATGHVHPYQLGLNEWSDLSPTEHQQRLLSASAFRVPEGWRKRFVDVDDEHHHPRVFDGQGQEPPPTQVDWRDPGKNPKGVRAVTSIRNQYFCGGCYSFATVAAVEGVVAADQGYLNELSDEQIIDCDVANYGCQGGDPQLALQYIVKTPLVTRASYPFTAATGQAGACAALDTLEPASQIQNYLHVKPCDDLVLMKAIARGPVVVAIDAYCDEFMQYAGGVLTTSCADPTSDMEEVDDVCERELNHAVAIVGYGTDAKTGLDYYLIKNSWGTTWGERGFARVARGMMMGKQQGKGGGGGGTVTKTDEECGLGCLGYYVHAPVGGVAYVNGTAVEDDDYPHGEEEGGGEDWKDGLLELVYDVAAGMAVVLVGYLVVAVVHSGVQRWQGRRAADAGRGSGGGHGLTEPLLHLADDEAAD